MAPARRIARLILAGAALAGPWLAAGAQSADPALPWPPRLADLDRLGRAVVAAKCPRPAEQKSSFVASPGRRDAADEMRSFDCREFRVAVYISNAGGAPRELPMELVVLAANPRLDARIGVGAGAAEVQAVLGVPREQRGENFSYVLGTRDRLTFEVGGGRVRAVSWSWEVD